MESKNFLARSSKEKVVPPSVDHYECLKEELRRSPEEAAEYLNAAMEEKDLRLFLFALKNVLEAYGGITKFSRKTKLGRVSIYKMLSKKGNPGFMNVLALLSCAGITLRAVPKAKTRDKRHETGD